MAVSDPFVWPGYGALFCVCVCSHVVMLFVKEADGQRFCNETSPAALLTVVSATVKRKPCFHYRASRRLQVQVSRAPSSQACQLANWQGSRLVIFLLVWDFYWRLFVLFLEPFLGTKKSPFLTPFAQPNQWENYTSRLIVDRA